MSAGWGQGGESDMAAALWRFLKMGEKLKIRWGRRKRNAKYRVPPQPVPWRAGRECLRLCLWFCLSQLSADGITRITDRSSAASELLTLLCKEGFSRRVFECMHRSRTCLTLLATQYLCLEYVRITEYLPLYCWVNSITKDIVHSWSQNILYHFGYCCYYILVWSPRITYCTASNTSMILFHTFRPFVISFE